MCQEKQSEKYNCTDHKNPPVKSNHKSYRCSNALPALKIKIKRKIMPQNTPSCCIQAQQRQNISIRYFRILPLRSGLPQYTSDSHTSRCQCPCLFAKCTQYIGRTQHFRFPVCGYQYDRFFLKCMRSEKVRMHIQLAIQIRRSMIILFHLVHE